MREDISEIKEQISCLSSAYAERGTTHARENERLIMQSDAAHRRLDVLEPKIEKMENMLRNEVQTIREVISPLRTQAKIITWVGVVLGGSIIGLVWMIILGQVQLVFP